MERVIKRDRKQVPFEKEKIKICLRKANGEVAKKHRIAEEEIESIAEYIKQLDKKVLGVEAIQDIVVNKLVELNKPEVVEKYIEYRFKHKLRREANTTDDSINEMLGGTSEYWNDENSNKNPRVVTTQRDYIAGICSTDIARRLLLPKDIVKAHDEGIIHFHDIDYYAQATLTNCCLINLNDMLQNGTMINGIKIDKPHKLSTATTIATQIIAAVASSQFGGCSINLSDLAPFVKSSYDFYLNEANTLFEEEDKKIKYADLKIKQEIEASVQTFNYQVNSMSTTNGQAPFISVFMYLNQKPECKKEHAMLIEEFLKQRILGMKNSKGIYITPAFPKLLYVLEEDNIKEGSEYWYLTELSAKCTSKRMVPDYISEKIMLKEKGDCFSCMGCRSFLSPDRFTEKYGNIANALDYVPGKHKYSSRFNIGVVTICLPDVALSSKGNKETFWKILDERLELCHRALQCRVKRLENTTSDVAPILWQDGAFARLAPHTKLKELIHHGYATASLGYGGVYEMTKYMTGKSHTDEEAKEFALSVMKYMNEKCEKWKEEEDIDYSIYGSPMESTTYKFAKCLKQRFGEDVFVKLDGRDRNYITNSYHIPVFEEIDAFTKLSKESEFQKLSTGGAISYVETPNLQNNTEAVLEVIKFIYDNIMYAELNTKSDYCQCCGYSGEIQVVEDEKGKLVWKCPNCGNTDQTKMNVARRTCGYIGTNFWNQGRTQEIKERVVHLDN